MKRHFLMLANNLSLDKKFFGEWLWSVKLDGMRAFWDGGISRGLNFDWCKDRATGLWSRYLKPIHAPEGWLANLPYTPLDGELWAGPGQFQKVMSICRRKVPDKRWFDVKFMAIDLPPLCTVFETGLIDEPNCMAYLTAAKLEPMKKRASAVGIPWERGKYDRFKDSYRKLKRFEDRAECLGIVNQHPVTDIPDIMENIFPQLLDLGHEGLMFRRANSRWQHERSKDLLKLKPFRDSEGIIKAILPGKGRHEGVMGAVTLYWPKENVLFDLGVGFTDKERLKGFEIGQRLTFKYRELTEERRPKEARYWRIRNDQ